MFSVNSGWRGTWYAIWVERIVPDGSIDNGAAWW
jgi:hypothetical protein